ncbi:unnamed protein product [Vitrella brassicaformis CCMP3155]|uniref:Protein kinase domain-containing protein n=1 Tax=Vitrella brassicaformis (strain CCMP3155) TaxID=1169540 RepID=A0A0G4GX87_VITBC|nr:unnamed protein product [Vitrella brassicaformis CCMP3155]|eukprot:CEM35594.1 unnamed protein product [Vitrella brassicaformis CCMP3155]
MPSSSTSTHDQSLRPVGADQAQPSPGQPCPSQYRRQQHHSNNMATSSSSSSSSSSIRFSSSSSRAVFEGGEAAIVGEGVTGVVRAARLQQGGREHEAAVKMAFVGDPADPAWAKKEREFEVEEERMRQAAGRYPFLHLLASDTDPQNPAIVTGADGSRREALCIASPLLSEDKWVELSVFFGWRPARPGSKGETKHNVVDACEAFAFAKEGNTPEARAELWRETIIITRALLLVLEAHEAAYSLGMLHLDGFCNNIMLPRAALESPTPSASAASAAVAADGGDEQRAKAIDLVNVIVAKARAEHSIPPPDHLGPFAVLVSTDFEERRKQKQLPTGTATFTPPEVQAVLSGPSSGEGDVWLGEPTLAWSFCMLIYAAARGRSLLDRLDNLKRFIMGERELRTGEKLRPRQAQEEAEATLLSNWEDFTREGALVITDPNHPMVGLPSFPPEGCGHHIDQGLWYLGNEQGVEWLTEWRRRLTAIAYTTLEDQPGQTREERGGLVADQSRRSTLKEIRDSLEAVLAFLQSPEVLDAVKNGTAFVAPRKQEVQRVAATPQQPSLSRSTIPPHHPAKAPHRLAIPASLPPPTPDGDCVDVGNDEDESEEPAPTSQPHCTAPQPHFPCIAPPLPRSAGDCVDVGEEDDEDDLPPPAPDAPPDTTTPSPPPAHPSTPPPPPPAAAARPVPSLPVIFGPHGVPIPAHHIPFTAGAPKLVSVGGHHVQTGWVWNPFTEEREWWQPSAAYPGLWEVRSARQDLSMRSWAALSCIKEGVETIGKAIAGVFGGGQ